MRHYFCSRSYKRQFEDFEPQYLCNLFGISFGGGKEKSSFTEKTEQEKTTDQITKAVTTDEKTSTGTQTTTGKSTTDQVSEELVTAIATSTEESAEVGTISEATQSLDAETQELLKGLVADLGAGGLQELVDSLTGRALSADEDLAGIVDPIVATARANLEEGLGISQQAFARSAGGSTQNTIVAQLGLREASRVEGEIASLAATLGLETRQLVTDEQTGAANLTGDLLTALTGVLKGSTTSRVGESTTDATRALDALTSTETVSKATTEQLSETLSETALSELSETISESTMQEIINAITDVSGSGKTKGSSFGISLGI